MSIMASQETLEKIPQTKERKIRARKSPPKSKFQRHMETRIKGWLRSPNKKRFKTAIWKLSSEKYMISMTQYEEDSTHRGDTILFHHTDIDKIMNALQSVKRTFQSKTPELFRIDQEGQVVDEWNTSQTNDRKRLAMIVGEKMN